MLDGFVHKTQRAKTYFVLCFFILMGISKSCFDFFNSTFVLAQETVLKKSDIDMSKDLGPIRDQGSSHFCVPNVVSDVFTLEIGERVSELSVALRYFQMRNGLEEFLIELFTGSKFAAITSFMLREIMLSTFCLSHQTSISKNYGTEDFLLLEEEFDQYRRLHYHAFMGYPSHFLVGTGDLDLHLIYWRDRVIQNVERLFLNLDRKSILGVLSSYHQKQTQFEMLNQTSYDMLGAIADSECSLKFREVSRRKIIGSEMDVVLSSSSDIILTIDEALNSNKIPIVNYDPYPLFYNEERENFYRRNLNRLIGGHVSSIVGRKRTRNGYMYLLRNTWGPTCDYLARDTEHICLSDGHIWISESQIKTHILSAIYITSPNK